MTVAFQLSDGARRLALVCLLAGLAAHAAPPPAVAQDCELEETPGSFATSDMLDVMSGNIACLERRLEALGSENAALRERLDLVEDARGAAAASYRNRDGVVDREDRYLGPATFLVTGDPRGDAASLRLDRELVLAMCGDADGCLASLGLAGAVVNEEPVETMFATGPCALHLAGASGTWSLSGVCGETGLPDAGAPAGGADTRLPAEPPAAPLWGRDGDASRFGEAQRGRILLDFAGACFLAEAAPETRRFGTAPPRFDRDIEADLYLVAAGRDWDPTGGFPAARLTARGTAPRFDCRLTFRD